MSEAMATTDLSIGIVDPIRQSPELLGAVRKATEYLEKLLVAPNLKVDRRELMWGCSDNSPADIVAHLSEWDRYGRRQAQFMTTPSRLIDPVSREYLMNNLLGQILREQFFQIGSVIDRGIKELEREEELNGHAH